MPVLIDGHNLIGQLPMLSLQDPDDEERLVRLLQAYQSRSRKAITVVFDPGMGYSPSKKHRYGGVEVVFAPSGSSADAVIAARVRRSRDPRGWLVVTSDRGLAATMAGYGARVQSARDFAAGLVDTESDASRWKDAPLSPEEVQDWLTLFEDQD
jgi:predicted RNA-binding protein with PIN domain